MDEIKLSSYDIKRGIKMPKILTEDLAYFCGIMAGDGNLGYRKHKKEYSLNCGGNPKDERDFYEKIISPIFIKLFGIKPKLKELSGGTYGFVIYSKTIVQFLNKIVGLPIGKKHGRLKVPKWVRNNDQFIKVFLIGLFDTDGCISFKKNKKGIPSYPVISTSSSDKEFIMEISNLLKSKKLNFKEYFDIKQNDKRVKKGFTMINRLEYSGSNKLKNWVGKVGFRNPKHIGKIEKYGKIKIIYSERRI